MKIPVMWALRLDELRLWFDQRILLRLEGRYLWHVVPPAGLVCRCGRGPYRSPLAIFPHALSCALRRITQARAG